MTDLNTYERTVLIGRTAEALAFSNQQASAHINPLDRAVEIVDTYEIHPDVMRALSEGSSFRVVLHDEAKLLECEINDPPSEEDELPPRREVRIHL